MQHLSPACLPICNTSRMTVDCCFCACCAECGACCAECGACCAECCAQIPRPRVEPSADTQVLPLETLNLRLPLAALSSHLAYQEWKGKYQNPATPEQMEAYNASKPGHAKNHDSEAPASALPERLLSDVCCSDVSNGCLDPPERAVSAPYTGVAAVAEVIYHHHIYIYHHQAESTAKQ